MQQPPKKPYYKIKADIYTAADKKNEADLAAALEKENFFGKKKEAKAPEKKSVVAKTKEIKISKNSPLMKGKTKY